MVWITVNGFDAVSRELERIKKSQAPRIMQAVADAGRFGEATAVNAIFKRYGYREKSYVEEHFSLSIHPQELQAKISARYRASTLNRFVVSEHFRSGKKGQQVRAGVSAASIRGETHWFKGAWSFIGRNGNRVMYIRNKGQKWRTWREARENYDNKGAYGPSVFMSFKVVRDDIEPAIIKHLRERYARG